MATWFLDPSGGNDANNGTTFAQRMKTFTALDAKAIAAGDEVRVMKTRDPVSLGVTGAFTDGSPTVTLSAAVTKTIDMCTTAWTASAGCTTSASTALSKSAANNSRITIGGAYVNGNICAYKTVTSMDLSAYQQLCFWLSPGVVSAAGDWEIRLCSDTVGAVSVYAFALPALGATGVYRMTVDKGSALTLATAIQSVALYRIAGTGTPNFDITNLFVAKAPGSSDCLTLQHQFGKNTDPALGSTGVKEWWCPHYIDGTTVVMSLSHQSVSATTALFTPSITTETVTLYARETVNAFGVTGQTWTKSGSIAAGDVTIQGGYDTTNMTSITGDTCLNLWTTNATHFSGATATYITMKNMVFSGGNGGFGAGSFWTIADCGFTDTRTGSFGNAAQSNLFLDRCWIYGTAISASNCLFSFGVTAKNCRFVGSGLTAALQISGHNNLMVNCFFSSAYNAASVYGVYSVCSNALGGGENIIRNSVFRRSPGASDIGVQAARLILDNCDLGSSTEVTISGSFPGSGSAVLSTNHDQTANNHQQWHDYGKIISDSSTRRTASGIAWKFSPTSTGARSVFPLRTIINRIYAVSGTQVTATVYCAKDSSNISIGLFIRGGQLGGPSADTTTLSTCATTSTYESTATQIQWTPTSTGWVEVEGICYGGTANNGWMDDEGVTYG
jgi:hypothetical protein